MKTYWVGKSSFKSWRSLARENLEHGLYNANKLSLLEDVHIAKNPVIENCDAGIENKENSTKYPNPEHCRVVIQNGGFGDHHLVPNNYISEKSSKYMGVS